MSLVEKKEISVHVVTCTDPYAARLAKRLRATCECMRVIEILYDDTECDCGRCYNLFGQELKSHEQRERERTDAWGEYIL